MPDFDSNGKRLWTSIAAGALGGLVGSLEMNQFQSVVSAASKALADQEENEQSSSQGDDATVKTAKAISETLFSHELTDDEKKWAGPAVHYTFGTVLGMLYGMLA